MKKILITGFEPFNNNKENPSMQILPLLEDEEVYTVVLPVSYHKVKDILEAKIKEIKPDYVISLGLAQMRLKISLELAAINYMYATIPDNMGVIEDGSLIKNKGPKAYFTTLPINTFIKELKDKGHNATLSTSAGSYVCNSTYYHLLDMANTYGYQALFIHLPLASNYSLEQQKEALKIIINNLK